MKKVSENQPSESPIFPPTKRFILNPAVQMMKKPIVCALAFSLTAACKRNDERANTSDGSSNVQNVGGSRDMPPVEDVLARLESAKALFKKGDIKGTLSESHSLLKNDPENPEILNLMGSCHVEMRDFEKALDAFTEASRHSPRNASILFNIGEVQFVTRHWNEAIAAFEKAKNLMRPEQTLLRDLIEFKILLCHAGLGNEEDFARLAASIPGADDTLRTYFTKAAVEYHSNNPKQAGKLLADAERAFPIRQVRAPWEDALVEFGYSR